MKYITILSLFLIASCNPQPQQYYQQEVGYVNGQPSTVIVHTNDGSSVLMNYLLWKSLMDQGGPNVVNNYYSTHRSDPDFQPDRQSEYQRSYDSSVKKVEQVKTTPSNGFGSRQTQTNPSNGFGSKKVDTKKSSGFGNYTPTPSSSSSSTATKSVTTKSSSGFGSSSKPSSSSSSTSTKKSGGFGKKSN